MFNCWSRSQNVVVARPRKLLPYSWRPSVGPMARERRMTDGPVGGGGLGRAAKFSRQVRTAAAAAVAVSAVKSNCATIINTHRPTGPALWRDVMRRSSRSVGRGRAKNKWGGELGETAGVGKSGRTRLASRCIVTYIVRHRQRYRSLHAISERFAHNGLVSMSFAPLRRYVWPNIEIHVAYCQ